MGKKFWQQAEIVENRTIAPEVKRLTLHIPDIACGAEPGQFVMIQINSLHDPLLNRPLGIARTEAAAGNVMLYYRVVGRGTKLLTAKRPGEFLGLLGPLGRGFEMIGTRPLIVGGGMGLAPLLHVAQKLCPHPVEVIAGGRNKSELFWVEEFRNVCNKVHVTTDDGSLGTRGTCVDILPQLAAEQGFDAIFACGPKPMLKAVAACAAKLKIPCQISLETYMACGFGACLTCTCEARDGGYLQVCKNGPVFKAAEVKLG